MRQLVRGGPFALFTAVKSEHLQCTESAALTINEEESTMAVAWVEGHIFVERKPTWYTITDNGTRYLQNSESKTYLLEGFDIVYYNL
ncbi:uncharacterized protein BJX67DRAFT_359059 [Aspergillus lucknowensis]|uniref:Uncharacterized protein n=1 Tax=Aspergillus lucknowensis TaxID=176173 RepID=A0ABR4LPF1_9EURO